MVLNYILVGCPWHNGLSEIIHENASWSSRSSAAKSMLPGNAKCSMTSLADTKHIFMKRFMAHRILQLAKTTRGWQTASTLRARRDYKVATLSAFRAELRSEQNKTILEFSWWKCLNCGQFFYLLRKGSACFDRPKDWMSAICLAKCFLVKFKSISKGWIWSSGWT